MKNAGNSKKKVRGFNVIENECIWMKTGVINFRECDNDFDCNSCPFDKAMQKAMETPEEVDHVTARPQWVESLKKRYPGAYRPCRHTLTGRIDAPKVCTMSYECYHCPFDQSLDQENFSLETEAPNYHMVSGYRLADSYYYHMGHSWVRFEHGGRVRLGFDEFMSKLFGPLDELGLPPLGSQLEQNQAGLEISRKDKHAAVLSPISGTVLAINHRAKDRPQTVLEDPFNNGWLCIVEPNMPKRNLKSLYYGSETFRWMENEAGQLMKLLGPDYERLAATGGEIISDIYGSFPAIGWDVLQKEFLKTTS